MLRTILLVGIGGGIGSIFRYLTSVFTAKFYSNAWPLATLLTNIIGCFLIGIVMGFLTKTQMASSDLKWLLVTGFCGGYTTFSAFGYENISLMQSGHSLLAFSYIALSVIVGLFAVWLGLFVAR